MGQSVVGKGGLGVHDGGRIAPSRIRIPGPGQQLPMLEDLSNGKCPVRVSGHQASHVRVVDVAPVRIAGAIVRAGALTPLHGRLGRVDDCLAFVPGIGHDRDRV
ncbi:MAG: hypothetical protein ACYSTT_22575 [Planctomycetota bacterium]